jgi:hypothetical protein
MRKNSQIRELLVGVMTLVTLAANAEGALSFLERAWGWTQSLRTAVTVVRASRYDLTSEIERPASPWPVAGATQTNGVWRYDGCDSMIVSQGSCRG